jgi:hypothetical protein
MPAGRCGDGSASSGFRGNGRPGVPHTGPVIRPASSRSIMASLGLVDRQRRLRPATFLASLGARLCLIRSASPSPHKAPSTRILLLPRGATARRARRAFRDTSSGRQLYARRQRSQDRGSCQGLRIGLSARGSVAQLQTSSFRETAHRQIGFQADRTSSDPPRRLDLTELGEQPGHASPDRADGRQGGSSAPRAAPGPSTSASSIALSTGTMGEPVIAASAA